MSVEEIMRICAKKVVNADVPRAVAFLIAQIIICTAVFLCAKANYPILLNKAWDVYFIISSY